MHLPRIHVAPWPKPPAADPAQELRAIRVEIAELKRRIADLEARVGAIASLSG
jgi:hypothetical protein